MDADKLFLYEKFSPYGAILSVKVLNDPQSGQCRGVGFVVSWITACCFCSMRTWYTRQSVPACAQYLLTHWSAHAWLEGVWQRSDCAGALCAHGFLCVCTVLAWNLLVAGTDLLLLLLLSCVLLLQNFAEHTSAVRSIQALHGTKVGDKLLHVSLQTPRLRAAAMAGM